MLAAFLTTIFFSLSAIFANRSIAAVGATRANLGRLVVALLCLGTYAHLIGGGFGGAGRDWFFLSGVIGMGLGDLAGFAALPVLGSRLTLLMTQCLAAPLAMLAEWLWLGTTLQPAQIGWSFVILTGVAVALLPTRAHPPRVQVKRIGLVFGFLAACGQGFGAVLSRHANALTALAGQPIDGITAAYQRIVGGLVITLAYFAVRAFVAKPPVSAASPSPPSWRGYLWVPANALCGAVIGVSCYQWSLATTPSGIVLPIVATTPLMVIPLSFWLEGEHPTLRSLLGGVVAVAGVIALTLVH
jgi:drug/metabolite transporter (DMT)-like permease